MVRRMLRGGGVCEVVLEGSERRREGNRSHQKNKQTKRYRTDRHNNSSTTLITFIFKDDLKSMYTIYDTVVWGILLPFNKGFFPHSFNLPRQKVSWLSFPPPQVYLVSKKRKPKPFST